MQEIIIWLRSIELLASKLYLEAACSLDGDQRYSSFLLRLSEDESWHYHIIGSAAQYLAENNIHPKSAIRVDVDTKREVEIPFHQLSGLLSNKKLTKKDLVDCIVKAEFSEFNCVFLYVVKTLGEVSHAFQHVAATIETHEKRIREFLEEVPEGRKVLSDDFNLPHIWNRKILVVEDEPTIREVLSESLKNLGSITTAADGQEGMAILHNNFFNVIISDVHMPKMSGIEFYQKAVSLNPAFNRQFLFVSGDISPETSSFMQTHHLLCIEKPFSLKRLTGLVQEIMDKTL